MNRRKAILAATASVAGASTTRAQGTSSMVVQDVSRYEVADAAEAESILKRLVEGPGVTVTIQSFSLTANNNGRLDLIIVSLNPV